MSYHAKIMRVADNSIDHALGRPSKVGQVRYSKAFPTQQAAQREADAWSASGEFAHYAPSDFVAEVVDGRPPQKSSKGKS